MKAALKATLVLCGFPALIWALLEFPVAREIALWAAGGFALGTLWLGLFFTFGGMDD